MSQDITEKTERESVIPKLALELVEAMGFSFYKIGWRHPQLNRCPECGNRPTLQRNVHEPGWRVRCDECFCITDVLNTPTQAMQAWNDGQLTDVSKMFLSRKEAKGV